MRKGSTARPTSADRSATVVSYFVSLLAFTEKMVDIESVMNE